MSATLTGKDSRALLALCRTGRLYEIEDWIKSGKSLTSAAGTRKTPLEAAMETGFHNLIALLARHESCRAPKNKALAYAVEHQRMDLIKVLVKYGAKISSVPFVVALRTGDPKIIRFFLRHGADLTTDRPFAQAFGERVLSAVQVFKDCWKSYPESAGELMQQAERALRFFSDQGDLEWVNLMLGLGADPRSEGPQLYSQFEDDPDCDSTAVEEACGSGKTEVLRAFKLAADTDNLASLLCRAARFGRVDTVRYLLGLGAQPNDKTNGGSSALDDCLWNLKFERFRSLFYGKLIRWYDAPRTIETLDVLLQAGALWVPDDRSGLLRSRGTLLKCEPELVLHLLKLCKRYGAITPETMCELLDGAAMRKHMAAKEWHMRRLGVRARGAGFRSHKTCKSSHDPGSEDHRLPNAGSAASTPDPQG